MKVIEEIIKELRQPFPADQITWKIQAVKKDKTGALVVPYIDARDLYERLNSVCPDQWSDKFVPIIQGDRVLGVEATLSIRDGEKVISRSDIGVAELEDEEREKNVGIKKHYSDAIKRAGVSFGIATSLYEIPQIWINEITVKKDDKELRDRYFNWITKDLNVKRFGPIYG